MTDTPGTDKPPPNGQPKRREQKCYGDDERSNAMLVLKANGGNVEKTARQLNIPSSTLRCWRKPDSPAGQRAEVLATQRAEPLADVCETLARKMFGNADAKAEQLDGYRSAIAGCALTDKAVLLRGQPTSIVGHAPSGLQLSPEQVRAFQAFLREMRANGQTVTAPALSAHSDPAPALPAAGAAPPDRHD